MFPSSGMQLSTNLKPNQTKIMNRYIKIKGHPNWFLVLEAGQREPENLSESMQEKIFNSEIKDGLSENGRPDYVQRIQMAGSREINYEDVATKFSKTLLIRPTGSYMFLSTNNEITDEVFDKHSRLKILERSLFVKMIKQLNRLGLIIYRPVFLTRRSLQSISFLSGRIVK
jgi:hypothetical protein